MKKLLCVAILLFSSTIALSSDNHPIKLTSSMIRYDANAKNIVVECKVFIDDFAPVISNSLLKSINQANLTKDDLSSIENYFITNFKISINDKKLPWKIESYDISERQNVLTLVFSKTAVTLKKGDDVKIHNTMLFETFGDIQSNWMTLRFPPLLKDYNFETNTFKESYSRTL